MGQKIMSTYQREGIEKLAYYELTTKTYLPVRLVNIGWSSPNFTEGDQLKVNLIFKLSSLLS